MFLAIGHKGKYEAFTCPFAHKSELERSDESSQNMFLYCLLVNDTQLSYYIYLWSLCTSHLGVESVGLIWQEIWGVMITSPPPHQTCTPAHQKNGVVRCMPFIFGVLGAHMSVNLYVFKEDYSVCMQHGQFD
jgi:hypothetical protein